MKRYIDLLIKHALSHGLIMPGDEIWAFNRILEVLQLDAAEDDKDSAAAEGEDTLSLQQILDVLTDDAVSRGITEDSPVFRDLFDTKIMGVLTPAPHEVNSRFSSLYSISPEAATDWYYRFSGDTNYIRRDRISRDIKWEYSGKYGVLEITINRSKPEKDPRAIAAAKLAPQTSYPKCQLCAENEGYAGRVNHPARQNHRPVPITINGAEWFLQYSPYVYYNEHCIVFNREHTPMKIDEAAFRKLLSFIEQFPHYVLGSNADLPIVGGSILSHDHFQGGRHEFPMAKAGLESALCFKGYEDVEAGIVRWPMSCIRLRSESKERLIALSTKILACWRGYTDEEAFIFAETDGEPHNTITPIARFRDGKYEIDLVLRNNITTAEHPLGVFHPHADLHYIKKENIGLIEVQGLAILPPRLIGEDGKLLYSEEEIGSVFERVLEDAGVYKCTAEGREHFSRFTDYVNLK